MGDFVDAIGELESKKAELEGQIKSATPARAEDGEEADGAPDESEPDDENAIDETQLKAWKRELGEVKKRLKSRKESFAVQINKAVDGLTSEQSAELLLTTIVFNCADDVDYYFHLFAKVKAELIRRSSGTTFLEISAGEFRRP